MITAWVCRILLDSAKRESGNELLFDLDPPIPHTVS